MVLVLFSLHWRFAIQCNKTTTFAFCPEKVFSKKTVFVAWSCAIIFLMMIQGKNVRMHCFHCRNSILFDCGVCLIEISIFGTRVPIYWLKTGRYYDDDREYWMEWVLNMAERLWCAYSRLWMQLFLMMLVIHQIYMLQTAYRRCITKN